MIHLIKQGLANQGKPAKGAKRLEQHVQEEVVAHTKLAQAKAVHFVGQEGLLGNIKNFLKDPKQSSKPFVIYGVTGAGKTALMAKLGQLMKEWFTSDCIVVQRVLGSTTDSSGIYNTVTSITIQICLAYGLPVPNVNQNFNTLYNTLHTFRKTIAQVSQEFAFIRPLFILLDGIDHLQPHDESLRALWALKDLPPNVHIVVSTVPHIGKINLIGAMQTLVTDACCEITTLSEEESKQVIKGIVEAQGRTLTEAQVLKIYSEYKENAQPLTLVVFTHQALEWTSSMAGIELALAHDAKDQFSKKLDDLENRYGPNLVTMFASYVTCVSVGIQERELLDLLSMNTDVLDEVHSGQQDAPENVLQVPPGLLSRIKYELTNYLEEHRAYGKVVLAWSNRVFYATVADKYQVIYPGIDEELINDDSTSFTLMLHEYMANMYLPNGMNKTLTESMGHGVDKVDVLSPQPLIPSSMTLLMRVPTHMKVLLPVEGVDRAKNNMLFNFDWLRTKIEAVPVHVVMQDILFTIFLTKHLQMEGVFEELDIRKDMEVLYEFFQLSYHALVKNPSSLSVEILARLPGLVAQYPMVGKLVHEVNTWLEESQTKVLSPVYPCLTPPEEELRHVCPGPTHVIEFLSGGSVAVMFSKQSGCDVWRIATGELMHRWVAFDVTLPIH